MNEMIVRTGKTAEHPYRIPQETAAVYTMEEFCRYLQEHLFLVNRELIGHAFSEWLEKELDEKRLAADLTGILEEGNDLSRCVILIFEASHLYSNKELSFLRKRVLTLAAMSPEERQKIRADYLLHCGKYKEALYLYLDLTTERKSRGFHVSERAEIHRNIGVIYARNLQFEEAAESFLRAYELSGVQEHKKEYLTALELMEPSEREHYLDGREEAFSPDDPLLQEVRRRIDRLRGGISFHSRQSEALTALQSREKTKALLAGWLENYEKSME